MTLKDTPSNGDSSINTLPIFKIGERVNLRSKMGPTGTVASFDINEVKFKVLVDGETKHTIVSRKARIYRAIDITTANLTASSTVAPSNLPNLKRDQHTFKAGERVSVYIKDGQYKEGVIKHSHQTTPLILIDGETKPLYINRSIISPLATYEQVVQHKAETPKRKIASEQTQTVEHKKARIDNPSSVSNNKKPDPNENELNQLLFAIAKNKQELVRYYINRKDSVKTPFNYEGGSFSSLISFAIKRKSYGAALELLVHGEKPTKEDCAEVIWESNNKVIVDKFRKALDNLSIKNSSTVEKANQPQATVVIPALTYAYSARSTPTIEPSEQLLIASAKFAHEYQLYAKALSTYSVTYRKAILAPHTPVNQSLLIIDKSISDSAFVRYSIAFNELAKLIPGINSLDQYFGSKLRENAQRRPSDFPANFVQVIDEATALYNVAVNYIKEADNYSMFYSSFAPRP